MNTAAGLIISDRIPSQQRTVVSQINTSKAIRILTDLQLPRSRDIIDALKDKPKGLTVSELIDIIKPTGDPYIDQPTISQALAKLRRHKVVSFIKQGKNHYYKINTHRVAHIVRSVNKFLHGKDYFNLHSQDLMHPDHLG